MRRSIYAAAILLFTVLQPSCVVVGYSSGRGWFFWPGGGLGLLILVGALVLFYRRRR